MYLRLTKYVAIIQGCSVHISVYTYSYEHNIAVGSNI